MMKYRVCLFALASLSLLGCKDDTLEAGTDESWRFEDPDGPDDGPLGDNGEFSFTPEAAGTAPGYYVVATAGGEEFRSNEHEIRLDEHPTLSVDRDSGGSTARQPLEFDADPAGTPVGQLLAGLEAPPTSVTLPSNDDAPAVIRFDNPTHARVRTLTTDSVVGRIMPTPFGISARKMDADDSDGDGIVNDEDNCPLVYNLSQDDGNDDGLGDACATDYDGDGIADDGDDSGSTTDTICTGWGAPDEEIVPCDDNCREVANPRQRDTDGDGLGDLCDLDRDDNGVDDLDEDVDWDGDGISTADEGDVDTDGDGIPDAFDSDDDNDGIPTAREGSDDTDGDGIPDDRDSDSDGDGIPDQYEGDRDTDGDGTPDSRDTDDDGDGSLTADEIQPEHRDPNGNLRPRWLDNTEDENTEPCVTRNPRDVVPNMNTFDGLSYWLIASYDFAFVGTAYSFGWATHFAPEGVYASLQIGAGITAPAELAQLGIGTGMGVIQPPERPLLSAATVEGRSISLSYDAGFASVGFTIFEEANFRPHRALQLDMGFGFSTSGLFQFPLGISLMRGLMAVRTAQNEPAFVFVHGWGDGCAPAASKSNGTPIDSLESTLMSSASAPATDMMSALRAQTAVAALPMFQMYAESGAAPAEGVPASSNGAWVADFSARDGSSLCRDCPDMSIDGVVRDAHYRLMLAGEGEQSMMGATFDSTLQALRAWPDRARHSVANELAHGAIDATFAIAIENSGRLNGTPNRYIADEVNIVRGQIGEPLDFEITAAEIADLIGASADDVQGATICMRSDFSGPRASDICGRLDGDRVVGTLTLTEVTSILYQVDVDLTTAVSDFDGAPVERWTVRPPMIQLTTEAGAPAAAAISAPGSIWSGAPTTLSGTMFDENGMIVEEPVSFEFFGPGDVSLGTVESEFGSATFQTQPDSIVPVLESAELADVTFTDDSVVESLVLGGTGLSGHSTVRVDGADLAERGYELIWIDSHTLVAAPTGEAPQPLEAGGIMIEVVSPGDARSAGEFTL
ncbi:MAG: hypothetical protein ACJAYU_000893 [Bradymonadia bacterium]|jgi:hypothetical protein